jgi:D-alanine-D-alanine ligase
MEKYNLLLLCGGGSEEHQISLMSADFFQSQLANMPEFNVLRVELNAHGQYYTKAGESCEITNSKTLRFHDDSTAQWNIDFVIPCIHGYPGETGDIQSFFDLIKLPYFGCGAEASRNCFNKVTAKMWFSALDIPNTDYIFLNSFNNDAIEQTKQAFNKWGSVFIKAASQGSSVGCYKIDNLNDIDDKLQQAFTFSPYILIEKTIKARELEVAAFEYQGKVIASMPGEIICANNTFYTFDEKYSSDSHADTRVVADLPEDISDKIRSYAIKAFKGMKLRHLSRIDFFLTDDNEILLNEINTFPGSTPISMFPKMLENYGIKYQQFLKQAIMDEINK